MKLRKEIKRYEMIPPWYGIAWLRYDADVAVCYPLGLNLIIRLFRSAYILMKMAGHGAMQNPREAYLQGFKDGINSLKAKG